MRDLYDICNHAYKITKHKIHVTLKCCHCGKRMEKNFQDFDKFMKQMKKENSYVREKDSNKSYEL